MEHINEITQVRNMQTATGLGILPSAQKAHDKQHNEEIVKEFIRIAYCPMGSRGSRSVEHILHPDNSFRCNALPEITNIESYVDFMRDLQVEIKYLVSSAHEVAVHYQIGGTHSAKEWNDIQATNKHANWTGSLFLILENGKIKEIHKDFNFIFMWTQFGWKTEQALTMNTRAVEAQTRMETEQTTKVGFMPIKKH